MGQQQTDSGLGLRPVGRGAWERPAPTSANGQWTSWTSDGDGWSVVSGPTGIIVLSPQALTSRAAGDLADALGAAAAHDQQRGV